jgi:hypothetical membrane protein
MEQVSSFLISNYRFFGLAGSALISIAVVYAALGYTGKRKESYSALNHFISELGEVGVSRRAWAFNGAMIAGGLLLLPFQIGLGLALPGVWGTLGVFAGLWAAGSCIFVGVFPMNHLLPHTRAAMSFFRAGLVMVVLFGYAIWSQPAGRMVIPAAANLFSLLAVAAYSSFLFLLSKPVDNEIKTNLDPAAVSQRPPFWLLPVLEWAVFFATMLWLFGIALLG